MAPGRMARALIRAVGERALTERESKLILSFYGIRTTREILAASSEHAVTAATEIGYPVVLKAESPLLRDKSEAGAVILDVPDEATLRRGFKRVLTNAWSAVPSDSVSGVLVQELIPNGDEVTVRMIRDDQRPPAVVCEPPGVPPDVSRRFEALCRDLGDMISDLHADLLIAPNGEACVVDCSVVPAGTW